MADWSDGYTTNIDYTAHFYKQLSPAAQNFALLLAGATPVDISQGFNYCELGCGRGFSTALLAAANPKGAFWGVDFNPAHIVSANELAHNAGLGNVTFLEKSFEELGNVDLPAFDFIALHGVWTWISLENRNAILAFIYERLKPGGIVYISYNTLPGWAAIGPLRQLFQESGRGRPDAGFAAVEEAITLAAAMREHGAAYFQANPLAGASLDGFTNMPRNYLVHEYFGRHWTPFYHSDVVEDLKAAKLSFACSCDVPDHIEQLSYNEAARGVLAKIADTTSRQTIGDYFTNKRFRRDLFTRGVRRLNAADRDERLLRQRIALPGPAPAFPLDTNFPVGSIKLGADPHAAIVEKLQDGALPIGAILNDKTISTRGPAELFQAIILLMAAGVIQPALSVDDEELRHQSTLAFNRSILTHPSGSEAQTLASPVLGSGVTVARIDQFLLAISPGGRAPEFAAFEAALARQNLVLQKDGAAIVDDELRRAETAELWKAYCEQRLPAYRRAGIAV